MPTTARLVAAILLAGLGWVVAELIKAYLPPELPVGLFSPISAGFGALVGWVHTGRQLGRGSDGRAFEVGLSSAALLVFWVTLSFSGYEMVRRSMRKSYDGPMEAVQDVFDIAWTYLKTAAHVDTVVALLVGAIVIGTLTRLVGRRFR